MPAIVLQFIWPLIGSVATALAGWGTAALVKWTKAHTKSKTLDDIATLVENIVMGAVAIAGPEIGKESADAIMAQVLSGSFSTIKAHFGTVISDLGIDLGTLVPNLLNASMAKHAPKVLAVAGKISPPVPVPA